MTTDTKAILGFESTLAASDAVHGIFNTYIGDPAMPHKQMEVGTVLEDGRNAMLINTSDTLIMIEVASARNVTAKIGELWNQIDSYCSTPRALANESIGKGAGITSMLIVYRAENETDAEVIKMAEWARAKCEGGNCSVGVLHTPKPGQADSEHKPAHNVWLPMELASHLIGLGNMPNDFDQKTDFLGRAKKENTL